jgi:hypothetical protein
MVYSPDRVEEPLRTGLFAAVGFLKGCARGYNG